MTARSIVGTFAWCVVTALCAAPGLASASTTASAGKSSGKAPAAAKAKPKAKPKAAASKPVAKATARARPSAVPMPTPGLSDAQLSAANQVLTGRVDCEFEQTVTVEPHATLIGSFRVQHNRRNYLMVPEETSTGAVRLFDAKAGVVWLQIPVKSMMMNTRAGRRMVDACTHPVQRQALADEEALRAAALQQAAMPPSDLSTVNQTVQPAAPPALPPPLLLAPVGDTPDSGPHAQGGSTGPNRLDAEVPGSTPTPR